MCVRVGCSVACGWFCILCTGFWNFEKNK